MSIQWEYPWLPIILRTLGISICSVSCSAAKRTSTIYSGAGLLIEMYHNPFYGDWVRTCSFGLHFPRSSYSDQYKKIVVWVSIWPYDGVFRHKHVLVIPCFGRRSCWACSLVKLSHMVHEGIRWGTPCLNFGKETPDWLFSSTNNLIGRYARTKTNEIVTDPTQPKKRLNLP